MKSPDNFTSNAGKILNYPCMPSQLLELTSREWDVLIAVANDLTSSEIAEKLSLTEKSVGNYRTRIGHKLNLTRSTIWLVLPESTLLSFTYGTNAVVGG